MTASAGPPPPVVLRPFTLADEVVARRAHEELEADGFTFLLGRFADVPWPRYLAGLDDLRRGEGLPEGYVPAALLAADAGGTLVGRASVRFELNDWLLAWGGHIGYAVRPAFRRRGYATAILARSLALLAGTGAERALLTCDDGNAGSATVIERCGGVLENVVTDPASGIPRRRYWIGLS